MRVTILAVTKAGDKFCVAGINEIGQFVRPVAGNGANRFWTRQQLIHNGQFIKCGDVWELQGSIPERYQYTNHTEDYISSLFRFSSRMINNDFINFLQRHVEGEQEFLDTVHANGRSLCLVQVETIQTHLTYWNGNPKWRMTFTGRFDIGNPSTDNRDYPVKDCKWLGLMIEGFSSPNFQTIFLCVGLAMPTPYNGLEYPQVIGLHTLPNLPYTNNYPD